MKLTIIGASGHGRVVADIAKLNGYDEIEFLDDNATLKFCGKYQVTGTSESAFLKDNDVFVAIGNSLIRTKLMEKLENKRFPVLIHPDAVIADDVTIGKGSVVMAGAVINTGSTIGKGVIINTCSSVDHDCEIGDYVHIAVGAHLCGTVKVGNATWIGAGATISNNITINSSCTIGIGTVVIKDLEEEGTYIGVPAKIMKKKQGECPLGGDTLALHNNSFSIATSFIKGVA